MGEGGFSSKDVSSLAAFRPSSWSPEPDVEETISSTPSTATLGSLGSLSPPIVLPSSFELTAISVSSSWLGSWLVWLKSSMFGELEMSMRVSGKKNKTSKYENNNWCNVKM